MDPQTIFALQFVLSLVVIGLLAEISHLTTA